MKIYDLLIESYAPSMKLVMRELVDILEKNSIRYIIGGANALSTFSDKPRTTIDIDAFIDIEQKNEIENLMIDNGFYLIDIGGHQSRFIKHRIPIDLLYASNNAERSAIKNFKIDSILDVKTRVPSAESLLWLYVLSDKEQNFVDAIELVRSIPNINVKWVKNYLTKTEQKKLDKIISRSKKPVLERKIQK